MDRNNGLFDLFRFLGTIPGGLMSYTYSWDVTSDA